MIDKIESVVLGALKELNEELEIEVLDSPTADTKLFGGSGVLNSLALVSLIADIESIISDEFDANIVLADERAMSQRISPFRSVGTLTEYIDTLLSETA